MKTTMTMIALAILALAFAVLGSGCATQMLSWDQQVRAAIKKVTITHSPPNTTRITYTLDRDPIDPANLSGTHIELRSVAMGIASQYWGQHGIASQYWGQHQNQLVLVKFVDPSGYIFALEDSGTPKGWHNEQTGWDFDTDECGRLQVYRHYEWQHD